MNLVLVEWDDAWQDTDNFTTGHGIAQTHKPLRVETLGWVIVDDPSGISLVNERSDEDGQTFRGRTFIPRAMIRKITPFNLTKKRTPKRVDHLEKEKADEKAHPGTGPDNGTGSSSSLP